MFDVSDQTADLIRRHLDRERPRAGLETRAASLFRRPLRDLVDNDCILWQLPTALATGSPVNTQELCDAGTSVACGQFADDCGSEPRIAGIRGFRLVSIVEALRHVLGRGSGPALAADVTSELDEQGCNRGHVLAGSQSRHAREVRSARRFTRTCRTWVPAGVHLVGSTPVTSPELYDRPADECLTILSRHRPYCTGAWAGMPMELRV